jgi:thiamine kinase-like enzyme
MIEKLKELILQNSELLRIEKTAKISFMKVGERTSTYASVSFLVFLNDDTSPSFFARIPRVFSYTEKLTSEFENLTYFHKNIKNPVLRRSIPTPLFFSGKDFPVIVEQALAGTSMALELQEKKMTSYFRRAINWLMSFHKETESQKATIGDASFMKYLESITGLFLSKCDSKSLPFFTNFFRGLFIEIDGFKGEKIPLGSIHGDFNPFNILMLDGNTTNIIDWEDSLEESLPLFDLFQLLVVSSFSMLPEYGSKEERFNDRFLKSVFFKNLAYKSITDYCDNMKINIDLARLLIPIYFAFMANRELEQQRNNRELFRTWAAMLKLYAWQEASRFCK